MQYFGAVLSLYNIYIVYTSEIPASEINIRGGKYPCVPHLLDKLGTLLWHNYTHWFVFKVGIDFGL
jgi:hypothetical protein